MRQPSGGQSLTEVKQDSTIIDADGISFSQLGARRAVLGDLSPAATFIAYNYNTPVDSESFHTHCDRILSQVELDCSWMYLTLDRPKAAQVASAIALLSNQRAHIREAGAALPSGKN